MTYGAQTGPEPEFLTVRELADLLRLKERKVYDLAASGAVPCSRATGKLLFPTREIRAWIDRSRTGGENRVVPPPVLLGSHDPLLDWALRQSGCGLASYCDGSQDGLDRFLSGEGVAVGLHLFDPASDAWNVPQVAQACAERDVVLIGFATRLRGLVLGRGVDGVASVADLRGRRVAPRQPGSGSQRLLEHLLASSGLTRGDLTLSSVARTEAEAVQAVARAEADVTFGLQAVAADFGLKVSPLVEERFDLLVDRRAWFEPPMQRLMQFCRTAPFAGQAARMGGYAVHDLATVRWNA